jgi:PhnB protein
MSKVQLSPYINFQGHAREAMAFYQEVFGGTLELHAMGEHGAPRPAAAGERIMHAQLDAEGIRILASDGHPSYPAAVGENVALTLSGTDGDRLTGIFNALAAGGKLKMPLTPQAWGGALGWLTDQFGINWMVNIDPA